MATETTPHSFHLMFPPLASNSNSLVAEPKEDPPTKSQERAMARRLELPVEQGKLVDSDVALDIN